MQRDNFCQKKVLLYGMLNQQSMQLVKSVLIRRINIAEMLQACDKKVHPSGETLPECVRVYCIKW